MRFSTCEANERLLVLGLLCVFVLPVAAFAQTDSGDSWQITISPRQSLSDRATLVYADGLVAPQPADSAEVRSISARQPTKTVGFPKAQWSVAVVPRPAFPEADRRGSRTMIAQAPQPELNQPDKAPDAKQTAEPALIQTDVRRYRVTYDSIPFSRAEYEANQSYRHEATMEFLFGQLRPMTIIKYAPQLQPPGIGFYRAGPYHHFRGRHYRGRYYRGRRTTSLNFWYPVPSVYRQW